MTVRVTKNSGSTLALVSGDVKVTMNRISVLVIDAPYDMVQDRTVFSVSDVNEAIDIKITTNVEQS